MLSNKVFIFFIAIFISSSSGIIFNCDFRTYEFRIGIKYACFIYQEDISGNDTEIVYITGSHEDGKVNEDVEVLTIGLDRVEHSLDRFPANINTFFPNLILIRFPLGNLTTLGADSLNALESLRYFRASDNRITSIDGDLFKFSPNITQINFENNLITSVGHDLFAGLESLTYADFRNNSCIDMDANSREEIEILQTALFLQCSPLDPPDCEIRCTINEEIDELTSEIDALADVNAKFEERFNEQENRIDELEELLRELCIDTSSPCLSV